MKRGPSACVTKLSPSVLVVPVPFVRSPKPLASDLDLVRYLLSVPAKWLKSGL